MTEVTTKTEETTARKPCTAEEFVYEVQRTVWFRESPNTGKLALLYCAKKVLHEYLARQHQGYVAMLETVHSITRHFGSSQLLTTASDALVVAVESHAYRLASASAVREDDPRLTTFEGDALVPPSAAVRTIAWVRDVLEGAGSRRLNVQFTQREEPPSYDGYTLVIEYSIVQEKITYVLPLGGPAVPQPGDQDVVNGALQELEVSEQEIVRSDLEKIDRGEFVRVSGESTCSMCGHSYYRHPRVAGCSWIQKLCDGRLVKL